MVVALTVIDEARSIPVLLDGLFSQTLRPSEVVITDGGSSDQTVKVIQSYVDRGYPVRLVVAPGSCRGRGRNLAVTASQIDLVALTDGGCFPGPEWIEQLVAELNASPPRDVVFGSVRPVTDSLFTECVSTALFPAMSRAEGVRVMSYSVASMLIRRSLW